VLKYRWTLIAVIYILAVLIANLLSNSGASFTGLFALVPVLLSLEWGPKVVLLLSLPLVILAVTDVFQGQGPISDTIVRTAGVAVGAGIGTCSASYRVEHATRLDLSRAAAEAAQEAILPAMPTTLGRYRFACAYRTAADESHVGGDLYKVLETEFGVRLLIGDVRGKGLDALSMTSALLGCFREWAPETGTLKHLIARLNTRVVDKASPGDFVTAIVASLGDDLTVGIANCGHPSPVHLTVGGPVGGVVPMVRSMPLGMDPEPTISTVRLSPGDRLFFYTDGLIESRDHSGAWIDLDDEMLGTLSSESLEASLAKLLSRFDERVSDLRDDMALLLVECV
jgi:serine phosphatase RsbU (regulator of sigma subunit)